MKRFTETTKWDDPWFRKLSPAAKLLWIYFTDKCNCVGLIELDFDAASFFAGCKVGESHIEEISSRLQILGDNKFFIPKFIPFQYGKISPTCPAHKPVLRAIEQYGLVQTEIGYQYPTDRVLNTYKKGKERKGLVKGVQGENENAKLALAYLNDRTGRTFRESATSLAPINARLQELGIDLDGVKKMIDRQCARWKGTRFEEYLRPSTLFAPEKFNEYYAAKDLPISENENREPSNKRNIGVIDNGTDYAKARLAKLARQNGQVA